jgi:hypothetical protein
MRYAALVPIVVMVLSHAWSPAQGPTARCSAQGGSVIRVRLLDPAGRPLTVPANAVIVSLHCGAPVGPQGIAELVAVPPGPHVVRVAALGCSPDSTAVNSGTADTVLTEVRLRTCYHVRHDSVPSSRPPR